LVNIKATFQPFPLAVGNPHLVHEQCLQTLRHEIHSALTPGEDFCLVLLSKKSTQRAFSTIELVCSFNQISGNVP
jgi:hypothetical protein